MNIANVTSRFAMLSGLANSEVHNWHTLIDDACSYIESHIKKQNPDENDIKRLEMLCAVYAFRLYCMCNDENITSFTAGDVKITSPDGSKNKGENLWKEYAQNSKDLIDVQSFLFGRVI